MSADAKRFGVGTDKAAELERRFAKLGVHEDDLVEKFVRSSGPGGQKVNKTSSAVQLKHIPSGIEVKAQGSRSQALNRFSARRQLADKLEQIVEGKRSAVAQRIAKIQRQKRRRSRRAKNKMLDQKRMQGDKKKGRQKVRGDE